MMTERERLARTHLLLLLAVFLLSYFPPFPHSFSLFFVLNVVAMTYTLQMKEVAKQ